MRLLVLYMIVLNWAVYSYANVFFMFAPYLETLDFTREQVGVLVGAFYAAATLIRPAGGWVVERLGIRQTMFFSACLAFAAALFNFTSEIMPLSFGAILAVRLAMGCSFGIFVVALTTYQSLVIPEETRGRAFALITLGSLACLFTVVPLAEYFLTVGRASLFLAIPVVMALLCMTLPLKLPAAAVWGGKTVPDWGTWGDLYRETPFWRTLISCTLFGLCDAAIVYIPALVIAMGLSPGRFVVGNGLGALVVRIAGMEFFNRYPRYVFAGPSLFIMAVFLYLTAGMTGNAGLFICGFFFGMGMGYGFPAHLALPGDMASARLRAKMSALVHFCYDSSWFILPVFVGFASSRIGEQGAFRILAVFCVIAGVGVTLMWRGYRKKTRAQSA